MRLLIVLGLAVIVALAFAFWLMRPVAENVSVSNAVADQMAIDQANSDIENEQRAAAAGLAGTNNVAGNARQNAAR